MFPHDDLRINEIFGLISLTWYVSQEMRTYLSQDMPVSYWHEEQVASMLNRISHQTNIPLNKRMKTQRWNG